MRTAASTQRVEAADYKEACRVKIAVASGKGGTGKTLVATNLAETLHCQGYRVTYLDCDVEVPNGHLFLKPTDVSQVPVFVDAPHEIDKTLCTHCGRCINACQFSALVALQEDILLFPELCHICGACSYVCPNDAVIEGQREIGSITTGNCHGILHRYGLLKTGETTMTTRLIERVKQGPSTDIAIFDAPPGTTCPTIETIRDADCVVLVADPTPFGLHDLALSVDMCRRLAIEPVILINRSEEGRLDTETFCHDSALFIIAKLPYDPSIAASFSEGDLIVNVYGTYRRIFQELSQRILDRASIPTKAEHTSCSRPLPKTARDWVQTNPQRQQSPEIVVISGKGGTGKTTLTAALAVLSKGGTAVDCDVDASNLPLVLPPTIIDSGGFSGGQRASIDQNRCTCCSQCQEECRFAAIEGTVTEGFVVNPLLCEGCALCQLTCPSDAVRLTPSINGEWFVSQTNAGYMAHARLGVAEENSGKLVTLNREHGQTLNSDMLSPILIDGAPGTGCPVAASLTGTAYAVIVSEPTVAGQHDLARILELTRFFGVRCGLVINMSSINEHRTKTMLAFAEEKDIDILGCLPFDRCAVDAQIHQQSVVEFAPDAEISRAIRRLWTAICDKYSNY